MSGLYVTTPIYYVNGLPHIGHAYTTIAADALTRWTRATDRPAYFLTGTDEHGQKVLDAAKARDVSPQKHVDEMVVAWKAMWVALGVEPDRFIRTTDADHVEVVRASLQKLFDAGEIYSADYEGWYYVPDEIFVTDKDVDDGKYDKSKLVRLTEKNWFFRMGKYKEALVAHIEANPKFIRPDQRKNEVLGFLKKDLGDLCISRPKARMGWGIPIPFDEDYVTYVWFDALLNYLTGIGWHPTNPTHGWDVRWRDAVQLLGKDILTTHAVYWSTMLLGLGVPLPKTLFAHGWWTAADGEKISKSKGNAIDIKLLADCYGPDAARYHFLREIAFGADGGFSYDGFQVRYNADLANDLGNLAHRSLSMATTFFGGVVPAYVERTAAEDAVRDAATAVVRDVAAAMDDLQPNIALARIFDLVRIGNKYVDTQAPWALNKKGDERVRTVMRTVLEIGALLGALLVPFLPHKAPELLAKFGKDGAWGTRYLGSVVAHDVTLDALSAGDHVAAGDPLFPRFLELPAPIAALFVKETPVPDSKPVETAPVAAAEPAVAAGKAPISYDDFAKLELKVGKIVGAEKHPNADRLLVLKVDVGEAAPRTIVAGIAKKFAPEELVGRSVVVVCNLIPAKLRGIMSEGMLLAAGGDQLVDLVNVAADPGTIVR